MRSGSFGEISQASRTGMPRRGLVSPCHRRSSAPAPAPFNTLSLIVKQQTTFNIVRPTATAALSSPVRIVTGRPAEARPVFRGGISQPFDQEAIAASLPSLLINAMTVRDEDDRAIGQFPFLR
jgi:hypothetical protein